ncbi:MAG: hypothetical protein HRF49_03075 [bacterium]
MAKKEELLEALVWLAKWYGGRRERLLQRIVEYEARITGSLFLDLEEAKGEVKVEFYGFTLELFVGEEGIEILSIEPPEPTNGDQLGLFVEDEKELVLKIVCRLPHLRPDHPLAVVEVADVVVRQRAEAVTRRAFVHARVYSVHRRGRTAEAHGSSA